MSPNPLPLLCSRRAAAAAACLALGLAAGGCEHHQPDQMAQAVTMGEQAPGMAGSGSFFGGSLSATVTISRGIGRGLRGGPGGKGGGAWGKPRSNEELQSMDQEDAVAYLRARQALGAPMPPVTLRLRLVNNSASIVSVEILDFESDLGNFAVVPSLLSLAPQQSAEPDAMTSQLGVTADEIPVKVALRMGGKTDTQVVKVRTLAPPPKQP